jgi:hypothetical protein
MTVMKIMMTTTTTTMMMMMMIMMVVAVMVCKLMGNIADFFSTVLGQSKESVQVRGTSEVFVTRLILR